METPLPIPLQMDEICDEMIINWNQTGINYVPISSWIMEEEGSKRVKLIKNDDKKQLNVLFQGHWMEFFSHFKWYTTELYF